MEDEDDKKGMTLTPPAADPGPSLFDQRCRSWVLPTSCSVPVLDLVSNLYTNQVTNGHFDRESRGYSYLEIIS